jgi:uncharacterized repeat protein (TIGR01451 family)
MRKPDFTSSTITASPAAPVEGDVVTFSVSLRNTGDEDASGTHVRLTFPHEGMFIDLSGLEAPSIDREAREAEATVDLPAGASRDFQFRVIAPRDSAGNLLIPRIAVQHFTSRTEHYDSVTVDIGGRRSTDGVAIGGYLITTAGLVVLALLISIPLLWLIVRMMMGASASRQGSVRRRGGGPLAAAAAIVIAIGFWTMFAAMAIRDYQSLSWPQTTCTILDRRLNVTATTSSSGSGASRDSNTYATMLAMRYMVNGTETYSTGFDTGSRLSVGGRSGAAAELQAWSIGNQVPCWYAPANPADIVVKRGFGGAYLFALFPLPVFLLGVWQARRLVRQ